MEYPLRTRGRYPASPPHFLWGRNRIDVRNKDIRFARYSTTVIGLNMIRGNVSSSSTGGRGKTRTANRNVKVANSNRTRRDVAKAA